MPVLILTIASSFEKCKPHWTFNGLSLKNMLNNKHVDITQWVRKTHANQDELCRLRLEWDKNKICFMTLWGFPPQPQHVPSEWNILRTGAEWPVVYETWLKQCMYYSTVFWKIWFISAYSDSQITVCFDLWYIDIIHWTWPMIKTIMS